MIKVDFDPHTLTSTKKAEWEDWIARAKAATENIIGQWESWVDARREWEKNRQGAVPEFDPQFNNTVWTGLRDWLLQNVFHNKCAYCETPIVGFPGDAEHFRPKGRVRDLTDDERARIVTVDDDGAAISHPGYFWLAYHWKNLLPSCELCNRFGGKQDLFPVVSSHVAVMRLKIGDLNNLIRDMTKSTRDENVYYLEPEDLDRIEGRVLLHPYEDNPEEAIHFKADGVAAAWEEGNKRAEKSIRIYALNHTQKVAARDRAQRDGFQRYLTKLTPIADSPDFMNKARQVAQEFKDEYYAGERPYAVAVFDFIHVRLPGPLDPDALLGPRRSKKEGAPPAPPA